VGPKGQQLKVMDNGALVEVGIGQAGGGGTLLSQNKSLVYYATQVNDVYAYFRTGTLANAFNPPITTFPTTQADLNQIVAFANSQGQQLTDANTLTLELKNSWVEATGLDVSQYVTMTATIPTYDFTAPQVPIPGTNPVVNGWLPTGNKTTTLALVGMHVVGSVQGHPEMIWATFEHVNNAPNGPYSYTAANGMVKQVPQSTAAPAGGSWLFCANNAAAPFNAELLKAAGTNGITPLTPGAPAQPNNTVRSFAWGGPLGNSGATENTKVISLNNSVIGMLANGDVRKNYIHIGSVWTGGGVPASPPANPLGNQAPIGSVMLSNATMESFHQVTAPPPQQFGMNCFSCHQGNALGSAGQSNLSHIWGTMKAVPAPPMLKPMPKK